MDATCVRVRATDIAADEIPRAGPCLLSPLQADVRSFCFVGDPVSNHQRSWRRVHGDISTDQMHQLSNFGILSNHAISVTNHNCRNLQIELAIILTTGMQHKIEDYTMTALLHVGVPGRYTSGASATLSQSACWSRKQILLCMSQTSS